ncbi:MAG: DNA polymerase III subunit delta' [Planctomycetota bacterium]
MDVFDTVVGHSAPKKLFRAALASDRLGHAYLFEGPDGVGKRTFAYEVARSVLCENPSLGVACGLCRGCRRVTSRQHSDLILVEREEGSRQIKIDAVRNLQEQLGLRAMEAGARVAILDDADRLGVAAGNSLLKLLEEPPARTLLLLLTGNRPGVLTTLVSRCQIVRFAPLSAEEVLSVLKPRSEHSGEQLESAAALAEGCPGKALEILDSGWIELRDWLLDDFLGSSGDPLGRAASLLAKLQAQPEGTKGSVPLELQRRRLDVVIRLLLSIFRDACFAQAGIEPGRWLHRAREDRIAHLASVCGDRWLQDAPMLAEEWLGALASNVSPDLITERLALDWEKGRSIGSTG